MNWQYHCEFMIYFSFLRTILSLEGTLIFYTIPPFLKTWYPFSGNAVHCLQLSTSSGITVTAESHLFQGHDPSQGQWYVKTDLWRSITAWPSSPNLIVERSFLALHLSLALSLYLTRLHFFFLLHFFSTIRTSAW